MDKLKYRLIEGATVGSTIVCHACKKKFKISCNEEGITKSCAECTQRLDDLMNGLESEDFTTPCGNSSQVICV